MKINTNQRKMNYDEKVKKHGMWDVKYVRTYKE